MIRDTRLGSRQWEFAAKPSIHHELHGFEEKRHCMYYRKPVDITVSCVEMSMYAE